MTEFNRLNELKTFVSTNVGVKGLVDAQITEVPRIFHVPSSVLFDNKPSDINSLNLKVPIIDLGEINNNNYDKAARNIVVSKIKDAAENWGVFQVINHGVPLTVLEEIKEGVRRFHEEDEEVKKQYITTGFQNKVSYNNSFKLYHSTPMNWRDSLICYNCVEDPLKPEEIPVACRDPVIEYSKYMIEIGGLLLRLLSEALGLDSENLKNTNCLENLRLICNYYPPCPQPDLTLGSSKHTDNSFITILLQDQIGGLQVLHQDYWVDVTPVPGALIISMGDFMQMITNDKFFSVEHRVRANRNGPRISVACFFSSGMFPNATVYGPIKELLSDEEPAKYRDFTIPEYSTGYLAKLFDDEPHLTNYRI